MAGLRDLPAVDRLAAELDAPHALAVAAARAVIAERREEITAGAEGDADLIARARERLASAQQPSLRRVINATGVIVHTNLGRAPLAPAAREAVARAAAGYSNLEWDARTGARGSRHDHVEHLLTELTGAEAGLAVNNCAAAVLLAAAPLAGPGGGPPRQHGRAGGAPPRRRAGGGGGGEGGRAGPAGGEGGRLPGAGGGAPGRRAPKRGRPPHPPPPRRLRAGARRAHRRDP